ncbi:MAG TPA: undecaprenyl-diphosphate phosphatase [Terriglobales bacterium]|nr:undecaprenyl-diphosphate phosphatase [Terriglobales bacterium]
MSASPAAALVNDYLLSFLLGVIEGLTEFLPVSSTAHLRIAEALFGVNLADGYWKMYSIVIQLGAILSLPFYFRQRIAGFVADFPRGARGDRNWLTHPLGLTLIAFACTAVPSLLSTRLIGKHLESLRLMAWALIVGGIVMWAVDAWAARRAARTERMDDMGPGQAVWIGLCQVMAAVFPGVSRSMATIAAGQTAGMTRIAALEFSFFLSIPTMAAATGYDFVKSLRAGSGAGEAHLGSFAMDAHGWMVLGIGFVVSFLVALGSVAWFMRWVRTRGFVPFAVYRIASGILVLAWVWRSGS